MKIHIGYRFLHWILCATDPINTLHVQGSHYQVKTGKIKGKTFFSKKSGNFTISSREPGNVRDLISLPQGSSLICTRTQILVQLQLSCEKIGLAALCNFPKNYTCVLQSQKIREQSIWKVSQGISSELISGNSEHCYGPACIYFNVMLPIQSSWGPILTAFKLDRFYKGP